MCDVRLGLESSPLRPCTPLPIEMSRISRCCSTPPTTRAPDGRRRKTGVAAVPVFTAFTVFADRQRRDPHNLPIVVAGGAGGRFHTGRRRVYQEDSPLSNLYVAMLDAFGTPVERFADSAGALRGVLRT